MKIKTEGRGTIMLKKGDFVEVDYTGRLKNEEFCFDTTIESVAKKEGIHSEKMKYGPIIICIGQGHLLPGLEKRLEGKELGKHKFDLEAAEAFGKKDPKLLVMYPANAFKKQQIVPMVGLQVNIDGNMGVIRTVSGGRIIVDYNSPLSGKDVTYDIEVKRVVTDEKEKVKSFLELTLGLKNLDVTIIGDTAEVKFDKDVPKEITDKISENVAEVTNVKKIVFVKSEKSTEKPAAKAAGTAAKKDDPKKA